MVERASNTPGGFLGAARRALVRRFVGRESALQVLTGALKDARSEPRLVHLTGPGGIGKTALLTVFTESCAGHRVTWMVAGSPLRDEDRLVQMLGYPLERLGRARLPDVLILDATEKDRELLDWMLDVALPRAGSRVLVVTAGREGFGAPSRARSALAAVTRELRLKPLAEAESIELLARRGVPERQRMELAQLAAGLPRALVELADKSRADRPTPLAERPSHELVDAVVTSLIRDVPSPFHGQALEALAVALALDQPLLAAMLDGPVSSDQLGALYDWLGALTFVARDPRGLVPHPRVRSALVRQLDARDPVRRRDLGRRAATELWDRVDGASLATRHQLLVEALFAQRDVLVAPPSATALFAGAREERVRHATAKDATLALEWAVGTPLEASIDPTSLLLAGRPGLAPSSAAAWVPEGGDRERPTLVVWRAPTEPATTLSAPELAVLIGAVTAHVEAGRTTFDLSAPSDLEELADDLGLVASFSPGLLPGHQRFGLAFEPSPGEAGVLELMRRIALDDAPPAPVRATTAPSEAVEVRPDWVRAALGLRHRPHELKKSPLVELRLVQRSAQPPEQALAALLDEVLATLAASPAYAASARLLAVTYFDPSVVKQEAAAAELHLPFGTYRYQLRRALELFGEELAAREQAAR